MTMHVDEIIRLNLNKWNVFRNVQMLTGYREAITSHYLE